MHEITLHDPQIPQDGKHKFGVTSPDAIFEESTPVPPLHEK
jgi:hypothetical protein